MPLDSAEKTEEPTPRRLQDAREKGQVARSPDLSAAIGLLAALFLLNLYGDNIIRDFMLLMQQCFTLDNVPTQGLDAFKEGFPLLLKHTALIVGPLLLLLVVISIIVNLVQVGFIFSLNPLTPKLEKISPIAGFKRLFSQRTAVKFAMSLSKVIIITIVAFITIRQDLPRLVHVAELDYLAVIATGSQLVYLLGLRLAAILVILALLDYAFQRYQWRQDLRMTKQEVKEEMKRMEGDPVMRQRRRNVARQLATRRMSQAVPQADVIITNPTELAIALKYDHNTMPAPKVVARGAGFLARRIREIANEHDVPIIERKPLAQALYRACDVGDFVPPELYKAVAEVLAYVFELAGKGFRRSAVS